MKIRILTAATLGAVSALALTGCAGGGSSSDSITFSVYMTADSAQRTVLEELISEFTDQTGVTVDMSYDTTNYESNLKVQMASNNLPDVFATHGWSVLRYSDFLEPLNDRAWVDDVNPALDSSMRDADGNIYALPVEYTVAGIDVNLDVLAAAGVDPDTITTWKDFDAALAKVAATGVTPITASGKSSSAGNMADYIASNAFDDSQLASFTDGDFDTDAWADQVLSHVQSWQEGGYVNPDYVSASLDDMASQLAQGQAAFALVPASSILATALQINPDANIGFIPIPNEDGQQYLLGGEGINSFGVAKSSANKEKALEFVDFLAQPENAAKIAASVGSYSGLTDVDVDLGVLQDSYDTWVAPGDILTMPFFDRVYLPNGIWATMISSTDAVIIGQASPGDAAEQMKVQFDTLYGQEG